MTHIVVDRAQEDMVIRDFEKRLNLKCIVLFAVALISRMLVILSVGMTNLVDLCSVPFWIYVIFALYLLVILGLELLTFYTSAIRKLVRVHCSGLFVLLLDMVDQGCFLLDVLTAFLGIEAKNYFFFAYIGVIVLYLVFSFLQFFINFYS